MFITGILGLGSGYYWATLSKDRQMEDSAFVGLMENLAVVHAIKTGKTEALLPISNINIHGYLNRLRMYGGSLNASDFNDSEIRVLNAVGIAWQVDPFEESDWREGEYFWSAEWEKNYRDNLALLEWAKGQCQSR